MKENNKLQIVLGILLAFTLISTAVTIVLNARFIYVRDMQTVNLAASTDMAEETILAQYDELISYNRLGGSSELAFPDLPSSESGLYHFKEVRNIFLFFQWGMLCGIPLCCIMIAYLRRVTVKKYLKYAACISLLLPVLLGILAALFWEQFFVAFHKVFFRNDYWLFDAVTDPIILLLPDTYFMHCAFYIIGLVIVGGIICMGGYFLNKKKNYSKKISK